MPDQETAIKMGEKPKVSDDYYYRGTPDSGPANPHQQSEKKYARIYANDIAMRDMRREIPKFDEGSLIIREKLNKADDTMPELIAVMRKRGKGFCKKCGDWEYYVIEGGLGKIISQEKKSDCSKCHSGQKDQDFTFRTYLKK